MFFVLNIYSVFKWYSTAVDKKLYYLLSAFQFGNVVVVTTMFYTEYCSSDEMCTESKTPSVDGRDRLQNTNVAQACAQHCIWGRPLLTTAARLKLIIVIRGGVRAAACRCPLPVCRAAVHVWSCRHCLTLANHFLGGISNGESELFRQPPHGKVRTRDHEMSIITSWNLYLSPLLYWPKK